MKEFQGWFQLDLGGNSLSAWQLHMGDWVSSWVSHIGTDAYHKGDSADIAGFVQY